MRKTMSVVFLALFIVSAPGGLYAQTDPLPSPLLPAAHFQAIRDESSGELPLVDYRNIHARFSGFAPSKGDDQIAEYIAQRMRELGLEEVAIEGFPADGKSFFWAFLTEPAWEAEAGKLVVVEARYERLADFTVDRIVLGRFSSSADVTAELVDVGEGASPMDYDGQDVVGKIVLATGAPGVVHSEAVWKRGAVGLVWFRTDDATRPAHLMRNAAIKPWFGPDGEPPGFAFSISDTAGTRLKRTLGEGEPVVLRASVKATTGPGEYKQVSAAIPGTDPSLTEVWVNAHTNHRNTGGANNLTGVGATIEVARVLNTLVAKGALPQPRRTVRFLWGAEHYASVYNFYKHPERRERVLSMLNVDLTGLDQEKTKAVSRMYRLPHSMPHFLSDVAETFMHSVGRANSVSLGNRNLPGLFPGFYDPVFAPTGSRDQWHYAIDEFMGPSDHEDVVETSIGVPAVLYNDWPDAFMGTQQDDVSKCDPTQMRRSALTVAATAYYLASVSPDGVGRLAPVVLANAQSRLAGETRRAFQFIDQATNEDFGIQVREAKNLLGQSIRRELATVDSLRQLGSAPSADRAVARARRQLEGLHVVNQAALAEYADTLAAQKKLTLHESGLTPVEARLDSMVPKRNESIRGPVHFFRPEYGAVWLRQKTGSDDFVTKVELARRGHYVLYEALNFANGGRTLLEIRNAVSAEYGPVDGAQIEQYFLFLEDVGVISMVQPQQTGK